VLALETNITAKAPTALPEAYVEREPSNAAVELPERYADWDEFRSLSPAIHREMMHLASRPLPDLRSITPLPVPEQAPDEVTRWGMPLGTLDITRDSGQHWIILGWLLVGMGLLIGSGAALAIKYAIDPPPGRVARGPNRGSMPTYIALLAFGGASVIGGAYLLIIRGRRLPTMLWIFEDGLLVQHHTGFKALRWEEILDFEIVSKQGSPVYWLRLTPDITVRVNVGNDFEMMPLMEYIEIRLSSSQFLDRLKQIFNGQREPFGILRLGPQGIEAPRFFAPWSEIRRVMTDKAKLYVDWSKRPEWVPFPYQAVSFPYLVVALASVLIDEQKRIPAPPG
jgi:hypothetical protein